MSGQGVFGAAEGGRGKGCPGLWARAPSSLALIPCIDLWWHVRVLSHPRAPVACVPRKGLPWVGQDDLLAGPGRWSALALLHGHQVAHVREDGLQIRHLACFLSPKNDLGALLGRPSRVPHVAVRTPLPRCTLYPTAGHSDTSVVHVGAH
jgi:hypothetical protein